MPALTLIVKATRLCNLRCEYCHDWRAERDQIMPFDVLARLTACALRDLSYNHVEFIWHGGETTLLPISFYEKALYIQAQFRRPGQTVRNSLQTNGTRLNPQWLSFFRSNGFRIGISLDGPADVHDSQRRYVSGRDSFVDVENGLRLLREYDIQYGVSLVVDEPILHLGPDRLLDFLLEYDLKSVGLLPARPTNEPDGFGHMYPPHYVTPAQMTPFLARLFDLLQDRPEVRLKVRELDAVTQRIRFAPSGFCQLNGKCLGQYFLVEPNGSVAHCDLFVGDERYTLGNIMEQSFESLRQSPLLGTLIADRERDLEGMASCPEFGVCQGWCPHERYLSVRHDPSHTNNCCGLKPLIDHIRGH
jgi:uncharacterized protein